MQSLHDDERREVLGEVLSDELKAILEYVKDIPVLRQDIDQLKNDMSEVKSDGKIIKAAVTDLSKQGNDQEQRLTRLEAAA